MECLYDLPMKDGIILLKVMMICYHGIFSGYETQRGSSMATMTTRKTEDFIGKCIAIASDMVKLPANHVWLDYDKEANVLYISFRKPQRATKTIETDEDMLIRKDGKEIVGLTIMNASSRYG